MQFLYPAFLWALTALSIPIILHLFYFRRYKKVYFSNLRFLREVREETSARNRLRNLLILISRLLALAFLIFAFAQPFLPAKNAVDAATRHVSVFVDNSFSMQSFGKDLSLFDRSRQKARDLIMGYNPEDRFNIIGHELSPAQHQWLSRDEALVRIEELEFTPSVKPLSVILGRQKQNVQKSEGDGIAWMISDFQSSVMDLTTADTTLPLNLLPMRGVQEKNVAIDTAWFESPVQSLNQTSSLLFTIQNYSNEDADNIRVTIDLDGQERPESTQDLAGGTGLTDTANITALQAGWHTLAIRISDFPVTFDDVYYMTFYVREQLRILSLTEQQDHPSLAAVFQDQQRFRYETSSVNQLQYANLPQYDLILLHDLTRIPSGLVSALKRYIEDGGKVLLMPVANGDLVQYNGLLTSMNAMPFQAWEEKERAAGSMETNAFVYRDVFTRVRPNMRLPRVTGSYTSQGAKKGKSLIAFRDGGDLLTWYPLGKGALCVMSAPIDPQHSDMLSQPEVFVPLLFNMAIYTSDESRSAYTIGEDELIPLDQRTLRPGDKVQVQGPSTFIPGLSPLGNRTLLDVQGQISTAGFYQVQRQDSLIAQLAFNYDRAESDLKVTDDESFPKHPSITIWNDPDETDLTELIQSSSKGKQLWRWCIILSLLFIGIEIALIRWWKNG